MNRLRVSYDFKFLTSTTWFLDLSMLAIKLLKDKSSPTRSRIYFTKSLALRTLFSHFFSPPLLIFITERRHFVIS